MPAPNTYTTQNAVDYAKLFIKSIPITAIDDTAIDMVNSCMWTYYPWKWTRAALTAISLSDGDQDVSPTNTNIYRLLKLRIRRTDTTPDEYVEIEVVDFLSPDLIRRGYTAMRMASWEPVNSKIRLQSAIGIGTGETLQLEGEYQKDSTVLTVGNGVFWFPDQYFPVLLEGLKWQFYQFADDPRAGSVQYIGGRAIYTGQWGVFMSLLHNMAVAEDLADGSSFRFPAEPLGTRAATGGSGFPFS